MKKTKGASFPKGRLAFLPTPKGREYFEQLGKRLTEERGLAVHVTQREAFDRMMEYALEGEALLKARHGGPKPPRAGSASPRRGRYPRAGSASPRHVGQ